MTLSLGHTDTPWILKKYKMTTHKQQQDGLGVHFPCLSFLQTWIQLCQEAMFNGDHPSRIPRLKVTLKSISPIHHLAAHQSLSNLQSSKWATDGVYAALWQLSRALKLCRVSGKCTFHRDRGVKWEAWSGHPSAASRGQRALCPLRKVKRPSPEPPGSEEERHGFQWRIRRSSRLFPLLFCSAVRPWLKIVPWLLVGFLVGIRSALGLVLKFSRCQYHGNHLKYLAQLQNRTSPLVKDMNWNWTYGYAYLVLKTKKKIDRWMFHLWFTCMQHCLSASVKVFSR